MKRGDVVVVSFPFAGGSGAKRRPALVVQADFYNQRITNVLLAAITGNLSRSSDAAHLLIDVSTPGGKLTGLSHNSLVSCLNIATVPASTIGVKLGELDAAMMREVDVCLTAALSIS
jgi:mRNA interferase MazF